MDAVSFLIDASYLFLWLSAVYAYVRHGSRTRRDIALMLGSLGLAAGLGLANRLVPGENALLSVAAALALLALPYLLLVLVAYFHPISLAVRLTAAVGVIASWVSVITVQPLPRSWIAITLSIYFVGVTAYCALSFQRESERAGGVVRNRLRLVAIGSCALVGAVTVAVATIVWP